jgi:hypothetical protein
MRVSAVLILAGIVMWPGTGVAGEAASDLSAAARKTERAKAPVRKPAPVYRWRPADPSFDQHGRPYRPPPGLPCPIDLGYGRWTSCMYR